MVLKNHDYRTVFALVRLLQRNGVFFIFFLLFKSNLTPEKDVIV